jgi:hypothetical protein
MCLPDQTSYHFGVYPIGTLLIKNYYPDIVRFIQEFAA